MGDSLIPTTTLLAAAGGHAHPSFWGLFAYLGLALLALLILMAIAKPGLRDRVFKKPVTQMFEQLYLFIENMCLGVIGPHGRKYIPMIMTFWLVIFVGNTIALFFPFSITASLSFNLAMAIISIAYVQNEGVRAHGFFGHLKHFAGPKLPIGLALFVTPLIFMIEIVSELMKNASLSLRLFGNIHGGHEAVLSINRLGWDFYLPLGYFLLPIKVLTVVVQALVFTLLTCVYLSLVTQPHEGHDHDHAHGEPAAAH